ncbi:MAG: hypothetical protein CVU39_21985 [Chloroflexi bacterium HGW-Chloroflexi-10]|nr:MAG: hypothetical protein CVU39_21985 [Chloroflexi bacterium HGW-Chloroflexi-10]
MTVGICGVRSVTRRDLVPCLAHSFFVSFAHKKTFGITSLRLLPSQKDVQDNVAALGTLSVFVVKKIQSERMLFREIDRYMWGLAYFGAEQWMDMRLSISCIRFGTNGDRILKREAGNREEMESAWMG